MRRKRLYLLGFFILLITLVIVALTGGTHGSDASRTGGNQQSLVLSKRTPVIYPPGIPAITPRTNDIPAYSTADAEQYMVLQSPYGASLTAHKATIVKIAFMTAHQVSVLLHGESIGRPDTALVCYVELRGSFGPPGPVPYGSKYALSPKAVEVFDAHTGNLLIIGVGD